MKCPIDRLTQSFGNLFATRFLKRTFYNQTSSTCCEKYSVIYYGTDEFSLRTLTALNHNRLSAGTDCVVDKLDVICIQNSPIHKYCRSNDLTIYEWPFIVPPNVYDVGIVISFGHLIQAASIKACKYGIFNAHPSLLPRWRGASPIISSILYGDKQSGVTIFQITPKKFDIGRMLLQQSVPIPDNCNREMLENILSEMSAKMVLKTLKNLPELIKSAYPQPEEGVTFAKKITPDMGEINWSSDSAIDINRKYRALNGIIKIYSFWMGKKVTLLDFINTETVLECKIDSLVKKEVPNGYCYYHKKRKIMFIKCKDGWVGVSKVIVPKRGEISAQDFNNGFITKVNNEDCLFHSSATNK